MTYNEKKAWLSRYQISLRRERELTEEVKQQEARAQAVTPRLSGMPGGGRLGDSLPCAVEAIIQAKQELQAQINQCGAIRREIVAALEQVTNARDHEIMRRRYILGQRFEQISVEMHMDLRWIYRTHKRTVQRLAIKKRGDED